MRSHRSRQCGFTLIEAVLVLAIAGILAMIGAPAMGGLLARASEASAEGSIAGSLRHARTAAVTHNTRVVVCPSDGGHRCQPSYDWQHGWIVAADADHDGQPDAGKPVIAALPAMPEGTRIITSVGRERITFHPNGGAGGSNVRFTICHVRERDGKSVVLSNTGRVRLANADAAHLQACLAGLQ